MVLHEGLILPILMYATETMVCKEDKSRIKAVQMVNLRSPLEIERIDIMLNENAQIEN